MSRIIDRIPASLLSLTLVVGMVVSGLIACEERKEQPTEPASFVRIRIFSGQGNLIETHFIPYSHEHLCYLCDGSIRWVDDQGRRCYASGTFIMDYANSKENP